MANIKPIPYGELENGMIVRLQGVRFSASEVTKTHIENQTVVRFTGSITDDKQLKVTKDEPQKK
jgi:hypothetical protein